MLTPGGYFDLDKARIRIKEIEYDMAQAGFWDHRARAEALSREAEDLRKEVSAWTELMNQTDELLALVNLAAAEADESLVADLERQTKEAIKRFSRLEFSVLLSGSYDKNNAIIAIHAGSGGTEAQDWAAMLLRMLLRYAEKKGWQTKIVDETMGKEAGIKSATVQIHGRYAYGYLKSESGVHRLVRISPFDAEKMRHTSFAMVEILPELAEVEEMPIDPKDLRVDTFMSSGKGGQSVNTTYSAVRIVHLPTGLTVSCQNERSQQQNKETAMKILKSRLHQRQLAEQAKEKAQLRGELVSAEWGSQIRSYVLHPYKLVKDHRSDLESTNPEVVLNGDLDAFSEAYLKWRKQSNI